MPLPKKSIAIAAGIFVLDRLTKNLAAARLSGGQGIDIFPYLKLSYVENTGAAFGTMKNHNLLCAAVAVCVLAFIAASRKEISAHGPAARLGALFIAGGAFGNLYDRLALGYVVDFIDLGVWPVFNVADSFLTAGAALLAWAFFTKGVKK